MEGGAWPAEGMVSDNSGGCREQGLAPTERQVSGPRVSKNRGPGSS